MKSLVLKAAAWVSDLRVAIVLLLLIAACSGLGTAIPQGEPAAGGPKPAGANLRQRSGSGPEGSRKGSSPSKFSPISTARMATATEMASGVCP